MVFHLHHRLESQEQNKGFGAGHRGGSASKGACTKPHDLSLMPQDTHDRREMIPENCSLTPTYMLHVLAHVHIK